MPGIASRPPPSSLPCKHQTGIGKLCKRKVPTLLDFRPASACSIILHAPNHRAPLLGLRPRALGRSSSRGICLSSRLRRLKHNIVMYGWPSRKPGRPTRRLSVLSRPPQASGVLRLPSSGSQSAACLRPRPLQASPTAPLLGAVKRAPWHHLHPIALFLCRQRQGGRHDPGSVLLPQLPGFDPAAPPRSLLSHSPPSPSYQVTAGIKTGVSEPLLASLLPYIVTSWSSNLHLNRQLYAPPKA